MRISEIFRSLQGEGRNQGRACTFVRLAGCNLNCAWCDTRYARSGGADLSVDMVADRTRHLGVDCVCITGGEPLLQGKELLELLIRLQQTGATVEIETNGTIDFRPFQPYASINMDVKCPSSGEESRTDLLGSIRDQDTVKFVVADPRDCSYAEDVIRTHTIDGEIFISPVEGGDYGAIAHYVLDHALPVRFQLQLHKIIGMK
jgi:7-carboxy-7-deazaguanine synthase